MKITTKDGYELEIKEEHLDDYELLEALDAVDRGKTARLTFAFEKLLGTKQKNELLEKYRDKDTGIISATKMYPLISEIMEQIKEAQDKEIKN
jgi:hypothetical protein